MNLFAKNSVLGAISTAAVGIGLAAAPVAVNTASAAIVGAPNMQQYCNRYHAPSRAVWVYQRNRWECAKFTSRFSRLYYRINYALACRTTHGTLRYRAFGARVLCDRGLARGDRVALLAGNSAAYIASRCPTNSVMRSPVSTLNSRALP